MSDTKNNTGVENSGYGNSGNWNSGNWNSGYGNSGNWNSGYKNSGDKNSGDGNSGYKNSGDKNSGYGNSTDRESGIFNSTEGKVRIFNIDSGKKWEEIDHPSFNEFNLTKWIPEDEMMEEEKKNDHDFYVRKGYLKTFTYKEAWANFWKDTTEENRQKFLNLPNFNWAVFTEITGIEQTKKETIKIGSLEYDKREVEERLKDLTPIK
jgi:PPE-repeat protein